MLQFQIDQDFNFNNDQSKPFYNPKIICHTSNFDPEKGFIHRSNTKLKNLIIDKLEYPKILISLSGGVDSLVCLHLYNNKYRGYVSALHINYMNRDTWKCEEAFVKYICRQMGIPLYIRRITEIQRSRDKTREDYEKYTNKLRFDLYKQFKDHIVILGHNYDDCLENIFSNIKKNRNMDNLFGMNKFSIIKEVPIYRPLLDVSKKQIIEYAHNHFIPYLEDSTPKWSERGRMRDYLIPSINEYSTDICKNLKNIKNMLEILYKIWDKDISELVIYEDNDHININFKENPFEMDINYLNRIFLYINKKYNIKIPNHKVLNNLISNRPNTRITYSNGKYIILNEKLMYILK